MTTTTQQTLDNLFSMLAASATQRPPSVDELVQPIKVLSECPACGSVNFKTNADGGIRRHTVHLGGNRIAQCYGK